MMVKRSPHLTRLAHVLSLILLSSCVSKKDLDNLAASLNGLSDKITTIEEKIQFLEIDERWRGVIDLSVLSTLQPTADPFFYVTIEETIEHLSGIKIRGRMLNKAAVGCQQCAFRILVGGQTQDFTVNQISSGHATAFTVYVPDVAKEEKFAKITFVRGSARYFR